ncbi:MAG: DUF4783 domain-containing protein [Paludibacteraceae bacterium]|nr:DUF4783 domain-containing protein [Candidatus Physcocola equi]MCQ2234250.1 DUF4783 domain-containing protein [Paludibacteraceae bacterium]
MKRHLLSTLLLLPLLLFVNMEAMGLEMNEVERALKNALTNNKPAAICAHLNNQVQVQICGDKKVISKSQTEQILHHFFSETDPIYFSVTRKWELESGIGIQGTLSTKQGDYSVFLQLKITDNNYYINQIRIENGSKE